MKKNLSKLERLDLAARALASEMALYRIRVVAGLLSLFVILLAMTSTASPAETLSIRIFAVLCVIVTLLAFLTWRYSFHAFAILFIGMAALVFLFDNPHTIFGWIASLALSCVFINFGYLLLKSGVPFAAVHCQGWETERCQAQDWFETPMNQDRSAVVLDIPTGSFWTGYFTYRLIHLGDFWAVMKFKTGNYYRLLDYRILDKSHVQVKEVIERRLDLELDKQRIKNVSPPAEVRDTLTRLIATMH